MIYHNRFGQVPLVLWVARRFCWGRRMPGRKGLRNKGAIPPWWWSVRAKTDARHGQYDRQSPRPDPLETPASITSLDGDMIRARGDLSIVEAETRAPGLSSVADPGNGGTALAARGFSGQGSVLQLIDGVRLFPAAGTITFPTDPWMVERIDMLGGPASVLYGQGALGGAVNVVMRAPTAQTHGQAEIGYGAQDSFRAAAGLGGPLTPALGYRVDASYRRSDGFVDRGHSDSVALSGTLRWTPSSTLAVTVRGDHGDQRPMAYFGTPLIDGRLDLRVRDRNYNVGDGRMRFRDDRASIRVDWTPSASLSLSNIAYVLTSDRFWRNLENYCWVGRAAPARMVRPARPVRSGGAAITASATT